MASPRHVPGIGHLPQSPIRREAWTTTGKVSLVRPSGVSVHRSCRIRSIDAITRLSIPGSGRDRGRHPRSGPAMTNGSTPRAVLLDATGTLFDVARPLGDAYSGLAREFGGELDADTMTAGFRTAFADTPADGVPRPARRRSRPCRARLVARRGRARHPRGRRRPGVRRVLRSPLCPLRERAGLARPSRSPGSARGVARTRPRPRGGLELRFAPAAAARRAGG